MKKSKLSIGLVTSFIGALALTSCGEDTPKVTKSKTAIVNFTGYNGKTDKIEINVDELYREYGNTKEGTTLYYNAILEALTRYEYPLISAKDPELKSYERIESEAKDKLKAVQQTAKDNAKNNGTDYDEEWDKILKSNDVKTTKALRLKFVYELEKEALSDWYFKAHSETKNGVAGLREQYLGLDSEWNPVPADQKTENVDSVYPYHILHILVKLSADKDDYVRGTITEAEATKLWQVVRMLLDSKFTWAEAAKLSDDTSKDDFGDVGIMSTNTSFYNEFKLGIYAFDALLSGVNTNTDDTADIYDAFGVGNDLNGYPSTVVTQTLSSGEVREEVNDLITKTMVTDVNYHIVEENEQHQPVAQTTLPAIPFDVFKQIGEHADEEKIGTFDPEGSSASLPRNVLFNAFLNFHSPFVITNELLDVEDVDWDNDNAKTTAYNFNNPNILKIDEVNFKANKVTGLGDKKVLCDAEGNVVIGVRSEAGIHFMVMRKSVFKATNEAVEKEGTSLLDYYTTAVPGDDNYPESGQTYVNMKKSDDISYYTNRANTIKSDIKSTDTFDAAYDYRIYEALLNFEIDGETVESKLHFSDEDEQGVSQIENNIKKNIELLRETHHENRYSSINSAWQSYLLMLLNQNQFRSDENEFQGAFVPTTCAFNFTEGNEKEWKEEGGRCYVK